MKANLCGHLGHLDYLESFKSLDPRTGSEMNLTRHNPLCMGSCWTRSCASPWCCDREQTPAAETSVRLCQPLRCAHELQFCEDGGERESSAGLARTFCITFAPLSLSQQDQMATGLAGWSAGNTASSLNLSQRNFSLMALATPWMQKITISFFSGWDSNAAILPYFRLLLGSLLWASHDYSRIKIWAKRTPKFAQFKRLFLVSKLQDSWRIFFQIYGHCGFHQKNFPPNISTKLD